MMRQASVQLLGKKGDNLLSGVVVRGVAYAFTQRGAKDGLGDGTGALTVVEEVGIVESKPYSMIFHIETTRFV